jgi:hypothetical protein
MARHRGSSGPNEETEGATVEAIDRLTDELRVMRETLDEIREDLEHALRNGKLGCRYLPPGFRLTSMSADPTAPDFAERVNALCPADLPAEKVPGSSGTENDVFSGDSKCETSANSLPTLSTRQFHHGETAPGFPFCCNQPALEWIGDHDQPEIHCAQCGEIVAVPADASRPRLDHVHDAVSSTPANDADPTADEPDHYCCAAPLLEWYGSPYAPSVACSHCGFVVVDNGCILELYDDGADEVPEGEPGPPTRSEKEQGLLFSDGDG